MNFSTFDDLMGSAPGASQNFGSRKENIQQKITQQRKLKTILQNLHKILKISKIFQFFSKI